MEQNNFKPVDKTSRIAYYLQIINQINDLIWANKLKPGEKFPNEFILQEVFGVSRTTLRQELSELGLDGLLLRVKGKGTFVTDKKVNESKYEKFLKEGKKPLIGWSFSSIIGQFWQVQYDYIKKYSRAKGYRYIILDAEGDMEKQDFQIRDLINRNVNAIICSPQDQDRICSTIDLVKASDIPFISINMRPKCLEKVDFDVGSDSYSMAVSIINWLGEYANLNNTEINMLLLIGSLQDNNSIQRRQGVIDARLTYDNLNIIDEIVTDWDIAKTKKETIDKLKAHPEINCIFIPSDYLLQAVIECLKVERRLFPIGDKNHVLLTSIDGDSFGLKMVREKYLDILYSHDPWEVIDLGAETAMKIINGEKLDKKIAITKPSVVNQDNLDDLKDWLWGNYQYEKNKPLFSS